MNFRAFLCAPEEFFHSAFRTQTQTANLYRCINGGEIMFTPCLIFFKIFDRLKSKVPPKRVQCITFCELLILILTKTHRTQSLV